MCILLCLFIITLLYDIYDQSENCYLILADEDKGDYNRNGTIQITPH